MRVLRWLGVGVFALGVVLLALASARGEALLYLVLIFPVIQATGPLAFGAIAAMFIGAVLFFFGFAIPRPPTTGPSPGPFPPESPVDEAGPAPRTRAGGVVFLGPLPIIFGSDAQVAKWMIVVAVVLFVLLVAFWVAIALL